MGYQINTLENNNHEHYQLFFIKYKVMANSKHQPTVQS